MDLVLVNLQQGGCHARCRTPDPNRAGTQDHLSPLFPRAVRANRRGPATVPGVPGPADRSPPRTLPARDPTGLPHEGPLHLPQVGLEAPADRPPQRPELLGPPLLPDAVPGRTHRGRAGPPFLRKFAVPFWALTEVFGRHPMYWHRLECSLGRFSLVGTTVQAAESLPRHLVADEKHTTLAGKKVYLAATAGGGCCLGMALAESAGNDDLEVAYGVFRDEARHLDPEYRPETVNTDGWPATQAAWRALFKGVTLILCFLHAFLKIRERAKHLGETFDALREQVWRATHSKVLFLSNPFIQQSSGRHVIVDPAGTLRSRLLRTMLGPRILRQPRLAGHLPQELRHLHHGQSLEDLPFPGRDRDHHPRVGRRHLLHQVVVRRLRLNLDTAMLRPQRRTDHRQDVVRHQRHTEPEQRRLRVGQRVDLAAQRLGQALEHVLQRPAPTVRLGHQQGVRVLRRQVRQQEQFRLLVPGRLIQLEPDAAQFHDPVAVHLGDADRLLLDEPGGDPADLAPGRCRLPTQRLPVLTDQEAPATGPDSEEEPGRAEVAVGDPQVAGFDPGQHRIDQGSLLGMGVLARGYVDDHHRRRIEDHQRLTRQGRGVARPRGLDPVLGRGQVIAVEDLRGSRGPGRAGWRRADGPAAGAAPPCRARGRDRRRVRSL